MQTLQTVRRHGSLEGIVCPHKESKRAKKKRTMKTSKTKLFHQTNCEGFLESGSGSHRRFIRRTAIVHSA